MAGVHTLNVLGMTQALREYMNMYQEHFSPAQKNLYLQTDKYLERLHRHFEKKSGFSDRDAYDSVAANYLDLAGVVEKEIVNLIKSE